jgi:hypothetical protein
MILIRPSSVSHHHQKTSQAKTGGIAVYGNANATQHGQNGGISIGGGYNDKSSSAMPYEGNREIRGGNGGIALCGTANGANATNGG